MTVTRFYYDADGVLVKKVTGDPTTHDLNAGYEELRVGGVVTPTKYYTFGSQRVAMSVTGTLSYLYADHLGSASLATEADGNVTAEMRTRGLYAHYPYGETRWSTGTLATDRRYTGQREEIGLGLYDYVARRYDPRLGRFLQADTIVPEPRKPQSLNRYTYVFDNPLKYTDPSGHGACSGDDYDPACEADFPERYDFADEQWQVLEYWAKYFGLPIEFVAAVLAAEIKYDTDWYDAPIDFAIGTIAYVGTQPWGSLADRALEESQMGLPVIGLTFGPGMGQVHAATAMEAEAHFGEGFPLPPASASERHLQLVCDFHNTKYVAAILRMYADQRPSSRSDSGQMTVDEMGAVFANYHEDVRTAFGSEKDYADGYPPTFSGQHWVSQLRPFIWYYRVRLGR